jgi:hypothetical protein
MDNMDFRKWLTQYGYTYDEYEQMGDKEKEQILKRFKSETSTDKLKTVGEGIRGCGCLIILVPFLIFLAYSMFSFIFS